MSDSQDTKAASTIKYSEWIITDNDDSVYSLNSGSQNLGRRYF